MKYTSLAAVKIDLWITWADKDTILTKIIEDCEIFIDEKLNIDWFESWETTETLRFFNKLYNSYWYYNIYLKNFNVKTISEVNWQSYTGVEWTDYMIINSRVIKFTELYNYINSYKFDYFTIKYTYWFDVIPSDVELMTRLLAVWMYQLNYKLWYTASEWWQMSTEAISTYVLWDERIDWWGWKNWILTSVIKNQENMFNKLFNKYKKTVNVIR